eukprot:scaffold21337_cov129-Isochrysis_galbana.AAC.2
MGRRRLRSGHCQHEEARASTLVVVLSAVCACGVCPSCGGAVQCDMCAYARCAAVCMCPAVVAASILVSSLLRTTPRPKGPPLATEQL